MFVHFGVAFDATIQIEIEKAEPFRTQVRV